MSSHAEQIRGVVDATREGTEAPIRTHLGRHRTERLCANLEALVTGLLHPPVAPVSPAKVYVPIVETDDFRAHSADTNSGGSDFSLVVMDRYGKPACRDHGAMNKVSPSPPGIWRCPGGLARCPAGCQEAV